MATSRCGCNVSVYSVENGTPKNRVGQFEGALLYANAYVEYERKP
jgi:hypothetical protein